MECAIRFNVSSTIIVLFQFQKNIPKNKKNPYIKNGGLKKKKFVEKRCKTNCTFDMFYHF